MREIFLHELKALLKNSTILLTVIGGSIFYSFLYPQPYLKELPRHQNIVLIDKDNSFKSRRLAFMIDATANVRIVKQSFEEKQIKKFIESENVVGYLIIPKNFQRDLAQKSSASVVFGANAVYMLSFGAISESIHNAINAFSKNVILNYKTYGQKFVQKAPPTVELNAKTAFNLANGYINYVVPAVFMLILHQIMLIGSAQQTRDILSNPYTKSESVVKILSIRMLMFMILYGFLFAYFTGFIFLQNHVLTHANMSQLWILAFAYIFSTTSLGFFLGSLIKKQELITFFVLLSSLILVFTSGFVWPKFAITPWVLGVVDWVPSTHGIMGFLRLNQLGDHFTNVVFICENLSILGVFYFLLTWLVIRVSGTDGRTRTGKP